MPYVARDGSIVDSQPLSLNTITRFFWGIVHFFICFFRGMFRMDEPSKKGQYGNGSSRFGNSNRRMGGFGRGINTPAPPPCAPGGG